MIFSLLTIHNHGRMPVFSNTRVLHTATRVYFTSQLPYRLIRWNSFSESSDRGNYDSSGGLHMMELGLLSSQCVVCLEFWEGVMINWKCVLIYSRRLKLIKKCRDGSTLTTSEPNLGYRYRKDVRSVTALSAHCIMAVIYDTKRTLATSQIRL